MRLGAHFGGLFRGSMLSPTHGSGHVWALGSLGTLELHSKQKSVTKPWNHHNVGDLTKPWARGPANTRQILLGGLRPPRPPIPGRPPASEIIPSYRKSYINWIISEAGGRAGMGGLGGRSPIPQVIFCLMFGTESGRSRGAAYSPDLD